MRDPPLLRERGRVDKAIVAAIIGAAGAVAAAALGYVLRRRARGSATGKRSRQDTTPATNVMQAGGDIIVSGRDTHITRQGGDRFMSAATARLVSQVADEVITDRTTRSRWSSFDARFLDACFRDTPRGWVFDGAASKQFQKWENDAFLDLGVRIYHEVCARLGPSSPDDRNLALVQEVYVTARYILRGLTTFRHPKKDPTIEDFRRLWDGSEPDWSLVESGGRGGTTRPALFVIFNRAKKGALVIDDLDLHREVVSRMKAAGVPVFSSLESAVSSRSETDASHTAASDATVVVRCQCGAVIMVEGVPTPPPSVLRVRCPECGAEKRLGPDDFSYIRVDK